LFDRHDGGARVSFTAMSCPHCGCAQPSSLYVMSRRERRQLGAEHQNNRRLVLVTAMCCALGVAFVLTARWAAIDGLGYGLAGLAAGVPCLKIAPVEWYGLLHRTRWLRTRRPNETLAMPNLRRIAT
jgi:hypothetical protein